MVSAMICDHLLVLPKICQNVTQFKACHVSLQGLQDTSAVQRDIGLLGCLIRQAQREKWSKEKFRGYQIPTVLKR